MGARWYELASLWIGHLFAYLPSGKEIFAHTFLMQSENYLLTMCQVNNRARYFSARPYFREKMTKGVTFQLQELGHWGPVDHLAIAETLKRYLVDEGYLAKKGS